MSRGLVLPARGSPRDLVLRELLTRERAARAAEVSLFARLIGVVANVSADKIDRALDAYYDQVTHAKYAPRYGQPAGPAVTPGMTADDVLLAKAAALSSDDD